MTQIRAANIDLAREFYDFHGLAFARAAGGAESQERRFVFSGSAFDDWAVSAGHMPMALRDAADSIQRNGLALARNDLRRRLNRAARKGIGIPRAYSIEARGGSWRVVLFERFLEEQPHEIVQALATTQETAFRRVTTLKKQANEAEHFSDSERTLVLARLEGAEAAIGFGMQQVEFAVHQIHPDAKAPDLRKLRREMSALMRDAFYPKTKGRRAPRAKRKASKSA